MNETSRVFLDKSRTLLTSEYSVKIERSVERLSGAEVWWRPNEASNSIGNLILHLNGNVGMWILSGVGRLAFERNRQLEFDERRQMPAAELLAQLNATLQRADEVLAGLDETELLSRREIQGYDVTVLEAIYHVVEHFGMHTGQIILLSKAQVAGDLSLWRPVAP